MGPSNSTTALSSAATNKPTLLHVPNTFFRSKSRGSPAWSKWVPRSFRRQIFNSKHDKARSEDMYRNYSHPREAGSKATKGSLRTQWAERRHRKSVTFEEPGDTAHGAIGSDGTVRRPRKLDGPDSSRDVHPPGEDVPGSWPEDPAGGKEGDDHAPGQYLEVPTTSDRRPAEGDDLGTHEPQRQPGKPARRRSQRTVSHDDHLTGRGANPRTGLVSPSVSSSSRPSKERTPRHGKGKPQAAGKWRLKGDQWISMDTDDKTPLPSPTSEGAPPAAQDRAQDHAQAYLDHLTDSGVPPHKMDEKFVVNMPSTNDPNPPTMSTQQISEFQRAVDRLRRHGGEPVDPNTPPTPRVVTPGGKSTPPNRLPEDQRRPAWTPSRRYQRDNHQAPEEAGKGHVQFARLPERRKRCRFLPRQARAFRNVFSKKADGESFLDEKEATGEHHAPAFQPQDTFLSLSPPWMTRTTTLNKEDSQGMQNENNAGPHTHSGGSLQERNARANMHKLSATPSMQTPYLGQPKPDNMCTTTITSIMAETCTTPLAAATLLHQSRKPQTGVSLAAGNRHTRAPEDLGCVSRSSSQVLQGKVNAVPTLGNVPVNVGVEETMSGNSPVRIETPLRDGTSWRQADHGTGSDPTPAMQAAIIDRERDTASGNRPRGTAENDGNVLEGANRTPQYRGPERSSTWCKRPGEQPTFACLCAHLQQITFSALVFCLNTMIYLCDVSSVHLHRNTDSVNVSSTERPENNDTTQSPDINGEIEGEYAWLWPLAGTVVCVILLVFVLRGVVYIVRIGLWAGWLLRLLLM